jgi:phenylpyruvate tautomerase PptA (4-oxalocrotonate tautomerase family)
MPVIEMYVPEGTVDEATKRTLHERVSRQVLEAEGVSYDTSPEAQAITWMLIRELPEGSWSVGGSPLSSGDQPRFLTRVYVPRGSMDDQRRTAIVERVNEEIVAALGEDPGMVNNICLIDETNTFSGGGTIVTFEQIMRFVGAGAALAER